MDLATLAEGLDPDQHHAVFSTAAPLAIIAGAGSGKTRVLTRRIARRVTDGSADAGHVLALTFTRRAAVELVDRLHALGLRERPTVGTFHAVAQAVLKQRWADLDRRPPELVTDRTRLLAAALHDDASHGRGREGGRTGGLMVAELAGEIDWARARLVTPARYEIEASAAGRRPSAPAPVIAAAFARYEDVKRTRRVVDFDDLLALCLREIERDKAFAELQRWRFRHLFIDEAQDLNPLQSRLLEAWRGGRGDLCLVGDPRQAIYGWNGADPTLLDAIERRVPGITVVRLRRNHRSSPQIVAAADAVLGDRTGAHPTTVATSAEGPAVQVHPHATEAAEIAGIATVLRAARPPGRGWSTCAVLARTNAQLGPIERGLVATGIPCRSRRSARLLEHELVRVALHDAEGYHDNLRGWLDDLLASFEPAQTERVTPPPAALADLADAVERHLAVEPVPTLASLRAWLGSERIDRTDGVDLVTFHGAKGLEWPVVVIAGVEHGVVPHSSATSTAARAEEVRLLHVAMTRAVRELHLTWAATRPGTATRRQPSNLLARLGALADRAEDEIVAPAPVRRAMPTTDPVLDALRAWRRRTARSSGLPEETVCPDRTLVEIAAERPSTLDELAAVGDLGPIAARRLGPRLLDVLAGVTTS